MFNVLQNTVRWFMAARPDPTNKQVHTQIGVHFEEVAEMLEELSTSDPDTDYLLSEAHESLVRLSQHLKKSESVLYIPNKEKLLDAIVDQIVTATGVATDLNFDLVPALEEVNNSNFSKFVDEKAVFDENGKIKKGPNYFKPNLEPFAEYARELRDLP